MMSKSERLICHILGFTRFDIRPIACALDMIVDLLFVQHVHKGDIHVTKDVYPQVARRLCKSPSAAARSIERLAILCWDTACKENRVLDLFGRRLSDIPTTSDILFYLAFLLHFDKPLFSVLEDLDSSDSSA